MNKTLALLAFSIALSACAPPQPLAVTDLSSRPAEQALLAGIRHYEDAQYAAAEREFARALAARLQAPKDIANAHKYLAFIYCTSNRVPECEDAFKAARAADPAFALTKSEQGHPLWGPVYQRVAAPR